MLRRNLLYAAVTRSKQLVILVGEDEALRRALTTGEPHRNSTLTLRLYRALSAAAVVWPELHSSSHEQIPLPLS